MTAKISSKRILNSFATAAAAQAESMRSLAAESERYARDSTLLALQAMKDRARQQGIVLGDADIAAVMTDIFKDPLEEKRVCSLTNQARKRQQNRSKHKDPFNVVQKTLENLRGIANARETSPQENGS